MNTTKIAPGASLDTLITTLENQEATKKDYIVSPNNLFMLRGDISFSAPDSMVQNYRPSNYAHSQLATKLSIPQKYYDRMRGAATDLLDKNVNHWLKTESKNMLIRTFENERENVARAFLSDRFGMIDNYEVLFEALEAIKQTGIEVEIVGAELSEKKMYLKVVAPGIEMEAKELLSRYARTVSVGTNIVSGFSIQNSEVGAGAFNISPRAMVVACNNGLVIPEEGLRRTHLGGKLDQLDFANNSAVRAANSKLVKEQVKAAVQKFLSPKYLRHVIEHFERLATPEIAAPVANVVEVIALDFSITNERKSKILDYFVRGGDTRRMGIVNAITEECQTLEDVDLRNQGDVMAHDVLKNFASIEQRAFKTEFTTN